MQSIFFRMNFKITTCSMLACSTNKKILFNPIYFVLTIMFVRRKNEKMNLTYVHANVHKTHFSCFVSILEKNWIDCMIMKFF